MRRAKSGGEPDGKPIINDEDREMNPKVQEREMQVLRALASMPFADTLELAVILGEAYATMHRVLISLLADGVAGRVNHGTVHLPTSGRWFLTAAGVDEAADQLGFATPSELVRAYPVSQQWLTLLLRRMDAVASVYRLATALSPGYRSHRSRVEFHRRGRFDATITLCDGRTFGVVRQGLGLRRRSLHDRLRAIAQYDPSRRPGTVLVLVPSSWEQRLTARLCERIHLDDCYVAVESRDALESETDRLWLERTVGGYNRYNTLNDVRSRCSRDRGWLMRQRTRRRASLPHPERMARSAPAFGLSPSEKRVLDIVTDHPMLPREHLGRWLGVSDGRVSQVMRSLVDTWGLIERHGRRGRVRYTLSDGGIRHVAHRDRAQLPAARETWSTALITDCHGRRRHLGHRIDTRARQTRHADAVTWFLSELAAETLADDSSALLWTLPTERATRSVRRGEPSIAPDAVGELIADDSTVPFYLECEHRARHPRGVRAKLRPYTRYYSQGKPEDDHPPFPFTLFVVDGEDVEATYARTTAAMRSMTVPVLVSCRPVLEGSGILGRSWRPMWAPACPRLRLSELRAYRWDALYNVMRRDGDV
ncbi:MAG: helix-turn-helix domain-containing protein [Chloroflexota bacterium]|nr:helix-turn-helix domain-containing protein [Chloroflexota bacterium]